MSKDLRVYDWVGLWNSLFYPSHNTLSKSQCNWWLSHDSLVTAQKIDYEPGRGKIRGANRPFHRIWARLVAIASSAISLARTQKLKKNKWSIRGEPLTLPYYCPIERLANLVTPTIFTLEWKYLNPQGAHQKTCGVRRDIQNRGCGLRRTDQGPERVLPKTSRGRSHVPPCCKLNICFSRWFGSLKRYLQHVYGIERKPAMIIQLCSRTQVSVFHGNLVSPRNICRTISWANPHQNLIHIAF